MKRQVKRLSLSAHKRILQRYAERDRHLMLAEALQQSIERIVQQDTGVDIDKQNWNLNLDEGVVERYIEERQDAGE